MKALLRRSFGNYSGFGIQRTVLTVAIVGMASVCHAQATAAPAQPPPNAKAVAAAVAPAAQAGQTAAPATPAPKGANEGIKVHGHWTIEVRNPDGKVATHREFENALTTQNPLAYLLTGLYSAGSWGVFMETSSAGSGPCGNSTTTTSINICDLQQPGSFAVTEPGSSCTVALGCFANLQVSVTGTTFPAVQLSGTATAAVSGQIGYVYSLLNVCSQQAQPTSPSTISPNTCFTTAYNPNGFTAATLSSPIPVLAGQTIALTVVLSFQ